MLSSLICDCKKKIGRHLKSSMSQEDVFYHMYFILYSVIEKLLFILFLCISSSNAIDYEIE